MTVGVSRYHDGPQKNLPILHVPMLFFPNSFPFRTYKKHPRNPFRIRTCTSLSKQMTYNPFTIRTYELSIS